MQHAGSERASEAEPAQTTGARRDAAAGVAGFTPSGPTPNVAGVLALQRQAGNLAVQRLLRQEATLAPGPPAAGRLQRQHVPTAPPPAPAAAADPNVERAIKTGDPLAITAITDLTAVPEQERIRFIGILNGETSEAISGGHIIRLWRSFPDDRFAELMLANRGEWDRSLQRFGGDPMTILSPSLVKTRTDALQGDIKQLAGNNLTQNKGFVDTRMQEMGLKEGDAKPASAEDLKKVRVALQDMAWSVWNLREQQKRLEATPVGARFNKGSALIGIKILMGSEMEPVLFDPREPPRKTTCGRSGTRSRMTGTTPRRASRAPLRTTPRSTSSSPRRTGTSCCISRG